MKHLLLTLVIFCSFVAKSQVNQLSIGASTNVTLAFNNVKYDPSDGSTVSVGSANDPTTTTGNDCFIVKLNSNQQIVWQKVISNTGDDYFQNINICANGDYLVVGKLTQSGVSRGFICRINKANGNIIWSSKSGNSSGEMFYDVVETASGNIAISGTDHFLVSGSTNDFVALLNSTGSTIWAKVSNYTANSDEAFTIRQLPNGNLIVGSFYYGNSYAANIMELDELTGNIINENFYSISQTSPNSGVFLNSLWPISIKIINGQVLFNISAFQGTGGNSYMCIYNYNQATKVLAGNIVYHSGDVNAIGYTWIPINSTDYLFAQSYTSPSHVYLSRVTAGSVVFDKLLNSSVVSIYNMDTTLNNSIYAGKAIHSTFTQAYDLISPRTVPTEAAPCSITNSNTLVLLANTLSPTSTSDITFSASSANVNTFSITNQTSTYLLNSVCGSALPITLESFSGSYNSTINASQLQWITASEQNSKMFNVERSTDNGATFVSIGSVNAHGFSGSPIDYNFNDIAPVKGISLYRLKEIDADDKFQYSNVVSIDLNNDKADTYYLSPNPAIGFTYINSGSSSQQKMNIQVFDASGRILIRKDINIDNKHPYLLRTNDLKGMYFIKLQNSSLLETKMLLVK